MHNKKVKALRQMIILLCSIVLLCGALYAISWYTNRARIQERNDSYSQLYQNNNPSPAPDVTLPTVADQPLPTPNADTLVFSLPTPPPVQDSFTDLINLNPDTVGFIRIGDVVELPVVQRENDNEFYLTHSFELTEASEGTLFLDGMNRLVPEDECLIIYGHNMHNGTMFGELDRYGEPYFLKSHPLVQFDTIYEDGVYVPFAAFPASMNPDSGSYFDVRQIAFSAESFDLFVSRLKSRSIVDIPVDAWHGDRLLLLVTCDYTKDDGRFILALRRLRSGETAEEASAQIAKVK